MKASEMVKLLEEAMEQNVGVAEVVIDGLKVRYDRAQLMVELDYWRRQAAKASGKRPLFRGIDLSGGGNV